MMGSEHRTCKQRKDGRAGGCDHIKRAKIMSAIENQKERRHFLAKLLLAAAIMGLGATTARAQAPPPAAGGDFASEMARLVERAAELVSRPRTPLGVDQVA